MHAAKPDEQSTLRADSISTLTPTQDIEMRRMDGDGFIAPKQARAEARLAAELRSSLSLFWKKIALAILAFLFLSWIGNACLMAAIVFLSKDLKVEGGSVKNIKGGFSVTTHNQRNVYEVTLITLGGGGTPGNSSMGNSPSPVVAQVACANVLLAIASIENGDDEVQSSPLI